MVKEQAFTFPFRDKNWGGKFLIGSVLILISYVIPIIPLIFVSGYVIRGMRYTVATGRSSLPDWDDWTDLGVRGILAFLLDLIYLLPGLVLLAGAATLFILSLLLGASNGGDLGWDIAIPLTALAKLFLVLSIALVFAAVLLLAAGALAIPIALARLADTGELGAALEIGRIWAIISARFWDFVLVWGLYAGLSLLASMVFGQLANAACCCVLVPIISAPISLYIMIFGMTLFARVYREGTSVTSDAPLLLPDKTPEEEEAKDIDEGEEETEPKGKLPGGDAMRNSSGETGDSPNQLTLTELGLPPRTERVLLENGFVTVGQLIRVLDKNEGELLAIRGFGAKSLDTLKAKLAEKGFTS